MSGPLRIVRLILDRRELLRLARRHGLRAGVDDGYVLHAALAQLFARSSERSRVPLHTFALDDTLEQARRQPEYVFLLAYSDLDRRELLDSMGAARDALVRECAVRDVPVVPSGARFAFRARVCPIVRTRQPVRGETEARDAERGRAREIDAWLASLRVRSDGATLSTDDQLPFEHTARIWSSREAVYGAWLAKELGRNSGALLEGLPRLATFTRDRLYRRSGDSRHVLERPNAVMEGLLRVADAQGFRAVVRRGLGRHRAFGFGMLLLRPTPR